VTDSTKGYGSSGRITLGPGVEFDLIRSLLSEEGPLPPEVEVGPGDDCVVLRGGVVASCDLFVEEVHFRRDWIGLEDAGYRAAAAALSDLAAMAAEPLGILLGLALPRAEATETAEEVARGARAACEREGIQILGGDISASPNVLVLDVIALGRSDRPVLRSGGHAGDEVWVTGWLGASAGAVSLLSEEVFPPGGLLQAFARPRPRIREARWLAERVDLHALIDLSDGLAGDAGHLAAASGVSVTLDEAAIPIHPALDHVSKDPERRLQLALTGGEDYEVCAMAPPGAVGPIADTFRDRFRIPLTRVGTVGEGSGLSLRDPEGTAQPLRMGGFNHLEETSAP
jgi:thiamine-monophosphate kinase